MFPQMHSNNKNALLGIFSGPLDLFQVIISALLLPRPRGQQKIHKTSHNTLQTRQNLLTNLCEGLDQRVVLDDGVVVMVVALSLALAVVSI